MPPPDPAMVKQDASAIIGVLEGLLPRLLDGEATVLGMKDNEDLTGENTMWRQTEWIGWWFEFFVKSDAVRNQLKARPGPVFANTRFDIESRFVWDLKIHVANKVQDLILNDCEAIDACIAARGGVGFIIVNGIADFDVDGTFKAWHDTLKEGDQGGPSAYVARGRAGGRRSRPRKTAFRPVDIRALYLTVSPADEAQTAGGLYGYFQKGFRNAGDRDSGTRRPKYRLRTGKADAKDIWLVKKASPWADDEPDTDG